MAKKIRPEDITREEFMAYEEVRQGGFYNMITQGRMAAEAAGLEMWVYLAIIKNYAFLKQKFSSLSHL